VKSEERIKSEIQLEAGRRGGILLWRNNVGAMKDERGRVVRYGLANISKAMNEVLKSGDFIGVESIVITPDMVGKTIGRFVSVEAKHEGWVYNPNDAHEVAQQNWADVVNKAGGRAVFASKPSDL
jgi:hypothetical protein